MGCLLSALFFNLCSPFPCPDPGALGRVDIAESMSIFWSTRPKLAEEGMSTKGSNTSRKLSFRAATTLGQWHASPYTIARRLAFEQYHANGRWLGAWPPPRRLSPRTMYPVINGVSRKTFVRQFSNNPCRHTPITSNYLLICCSHLRMKHAFFGLSMTFHCCTHRLLCGKVALMTRRAHASSPRPEHVC